MTNFGSNAQTIHSSVSHELVQKVLQIASLKIAVERAKKQTFFFKRLALRRKQFRRTFFSCLMGRLLIAWEVGKGEGDLTSLPKAV